jgi:hypothetical protein
MFNLKSLLLSAFLLNFVAAAIIPRNNEVTVHQFRDCIKSANANAVKKGAIECNVDGVAFFCKAVGKGWTWNGSNKEWECQKDKPQNGNSQNGNTVKPVKPGNSQNGNTVKPGKPGNSQQPEKVTVHQFKDCIKSANANAVKKGAIECNVDGVKFSCNAVGNGWKWKGSNKEWECHLK